MCVTDVIHALLYPIFSMSQIICSNIFVDNYVDWNIMLNDIKIGSNYSCYLFDI